MLTPLVCRLVVHVRHTPARPYHCGEFTPLSVTSTSSPRWNQPAWRAPHCRRRGACNVMASGNMLTACGKVTSRLGKWLGRCKGLCSTQHEGSIPHVLKCGMSAVRFNDSCLDVRACGGNRGETRRMAAFRAVSISVAIAALRVHAQDVDYTQFVNPFIGSEGKIPGYVCKSNTAQLLPEP